MLDETHVDMLRADAALSSAYATIEQLRRELDAARRWAKTWKREAYVEWMAFQSANRAATVECEKAMKAEAELDAAKALIERMRRTQKEHDNAT